MLDIVTCKNDLYAMFISLFQALCKCLLAYVRPIFKVPQNVGM